MSLFKQPALDESEEPYVFLSGVTQTLYSVCQFSIDSEEGQISSQVILITEFEGKKLVAFPFGVWHRNLQRRVLPSQCLAKPVLVEVQACRPEALDEPLEELYIKLWIGYLKEEFFAQVESHLEEFEFDCDYVFGVVPHEILLPSADALVAVAQDHFAFFSAAEEEAALVEVEEGEEGDILAEEEREKPARKARAKAAASGSAGLAKRVEAIELAVDKIADAVGRISKSSPPTSTPTSSAKSSPKVMSPKPKIANKRPSALRNKYPLLDGGV